MNKLLMRVLAIVLTIALVCGFCVMGAAATATDEEAQPAETGAGQSGADTVSAAANVTEAAADGKVGVFAAAEEKAASAGESGAEYNGFIFKLADGTMTTMDADEAEGIDSVDYADGLFTAEALEQVEDFVSESGIEYIEPNYIIHLYDSDMGTASVTEPNDPYYTAGYQWNLTQMHVQEIWALGIEGQDMDSTIDTDHDGVTGNDDVIIAVIDSGLKVNHEDINWSHILTGKNFVNTGTTSTDDTLGHGTFCTGLIMGTKDNSKGISGIAQSIYVMPLKVFEEDSVESSVIISAINYAASERATFNSTNGAEGANISVINMSLGGSSSESAMKAAVDAAIEAGIIVICAAGNDGDTTASYPAQYAIGIGSTDSSETVSYYSQRLSASNGTGYANKVWVMAPGESVTSLYKSSTSSYYTASGTSFSSPEVAALAALAVSLKNDLTTYYNDSSITTNHAAFKQLLKDTASPVAGSSGSINGQDIEYGWGLVNFSTTLMALVDNLDGTGEVTIGIINEAGTVIPGAEITVTDPDTGAEISPDENGVYTLQLGHRYSYTASANKYETQTGTLVTLTAERAVTITLVGQSYTTRFAVFNSLDEIVSNASISVTRVGGSALEQNADGSFSTRNGDYRFTVSAGGYFSASGAFTIDDLTDATLETSGRTISVRLYGDIDVCSMKLKIVGSDGSDITDDMTSSNGSYTYDTTITLLSSDGIEQYEYTDGYYKLAPDTYTYTVENDDYKTVTGSFIIFESAKSTVAERTIYMPERLYYVYFDVMPLYAAKTVTVTNGLGETEHQLVSANMAIEYQLCNGTYRYRVESAGRNTLTGTFNVAGATVNVETPRLTTGSDVIDDGTSDTEFITINSSLFAVSALKSYEASESCNVGGNTATYTGISLSDLVAHFTSNVQTAAAITVTAGDRLEYSVAADSFDSAMIAWTDDGLCLVIDGASAVIWNPLIITIDYHIHTENIQILTAATCTEQGLARYVCTDCGNVREAATPALGHIYDENTGLCTRCGEPVSFDTDTEITVAGVTVTSAQLRLYTTYATYTMIDNYSGESESHYVAGILLSDLVEHFIPDRCVKTLYVTSVDEYNMTWSKSEFSSTMIAWSIDGAAPGSYSYDNGLRVCQDEGYSGAWMYSPLSFAVSSGNDHSYGEAVTVAPTCVSKGYTCEECSECGHIHYYDYVDATGEHTWNAGTVLTPVTCVTDGTVLHNCADCGLPMIETVSAPGHDWVDGTCARCGAEKFEVPPVTITENSDGAPVAEVTAPEGGWITGSVSFTVASDSACTVVLKTGDSYTRLEATDKGNGTYSFAAELQSDSEIFVMLTGDANGDGVLGVADVLLATKASAAKNQTGAVSLAMDVNGDGAVNVFDVMSILAAALCKSIFNW